MNENVFGYLGVNTNSNNVIDISSNSRYSVETREACKQNHPYLHSVIIVHFLFDLKQITK